MTMDIRRFSALAWNLLGQGASALFGLVLIKISVSGFSVPTYGVVALLLGLQTLARGLALNPLINLAVYATPNEGASRGIGWVYGVTSRSLVFASGFLLPLFLIAIWALRIPTANLGMAAMLLGTLLLSEALKTARLNLLHCRDESRRFALWTILDGASKPALVLLALGMPLQRSAFLLLSAQLAASLAVLALTQADPMIRTFRLEVSGPDEKWTPLEWAKTHRGFLMPLVGLGVTGWVTGLSDRYLVNLFLGAEKAGLYTGIYALFATPFLILGGALTLAYRPQLLALYAESVGSAWREAHRHAIAWTAFFAIALAMGLYGLRRQLISLVLAPSYLGAMGAVPGLLIGNSLITVGIMIELNFYLQRRSGLVLAKQATGSFLAIATVLAMLPHFGLAGAGWACPLYAGVECLVGLGLMRAAR